MRRSNVSLDWIREHIADGFIQQFEMCRCADHQIHLRCLWYNRDKYKVEIHYSNKFEASLIMSFVKQCERKFNTLSVRLDNHHIYSNTPY